MNRRRPSHLHGKFSISIIGIVAIFLVVCVGCAFLKGPFDWRTEKPQWAVPITTDAEAIEAANIVTPLKVDVRVERVERGTLAQMVHGFVGSARFPTIPEVNGVITDDVWRVELTTPASGSCTYLFHALTGMLLQNLCIGLDANTFRFATESREPDLAAAPGAYTPS